MARPADPGKREHQRRRATAGLGLRAQLNLLAGIRFDQSGASSMPLRAPQSGGVSIPI